MSVSNVYANMVKRAFDLEQENAKLQAQLATAKREVWTRVDEYYSRTIHHDMDDYPDKFVKWVRQQKEAL